MRPSEQVTSLGTQLMNNIVLITGVLTQVIDTFEGMVDTKDYDNDQ